MVTKYLPLELIGLEAGWADRFLSKPTGLGVVVQYLHFLGLVKRMGVGFGLLFLLMNWCFLGLLIFTNFADSKACDCGGFPFFSWRFR